MTQAKLLRNGTVLSLDDQGSRHAAMALRDGGVLAVGSDDAVRAKAGDDADLIDLEGGVVVPGFIDAHHHFSYWVLGLLGIDCRQVTSIPEIGDLVRHQADKVPAGEWIRGFAYNEHSLAEGRHPTRDDLDAAAPDHPVVISHVTCHQCVANSAALAAAGIGESSVDPPGGVIARDRRGRPTGLLLEVAAEIVDAPLRGRLLHADPSAAREAAGRAADQQLSFGITQLCDPCVDPVTERFYADVHRQIPIRVHALGVGAEGMFQPPDQRITAPDSHDGFRISGVKYFADGGDQCAFCLSVGTVVRGVIAVTARSLRDRSLAGLRLAGQSQLRFQGGRAHTGISFYRPGELDDRACRTAEHDLTVAVHAIGNEAIDTTLDSLTEVRRTVGDAARLRVEHAMFPEPGDIDRLADLGIRAVMQPRFVHDFGGLFQSGGVDRQLPSIPIRSLLRAGATVAGSSDAPVTVPDVLAAIQSAVTRVTGDGSILAPDEGLNPEEALRLYTNGSAATLGVSEDFGSLEAGKAADFAVLSADPTRVPAHRIGEIDVLETWIAGERVYHTDGDGNRS